MDCGVFIIINYIILFTKTNKNNLSLFLPTLNYIYITLNNKIFICIKYYFITVIRCGGCFFHACDM